MDSYRIYNKRGKTPGNLEHLTDRSGYRQRNGGGNPPFEYAAYGFAAPACPGFCPSTIKALRTLMPRYFFDFRDGDDVTPDEDGTEINTPEQMRSAAMRVLLEVSQMMLPDGDHRRFEVIVREDRTRAIYRAQMTFLGEWLS